MADFAHWCPQCGDTLPHCFPYCQDQTPTPLYVEVNVVAQYLVGVPTYVEFRLKNVSERPLILHHMTVRIGENTLAPGIHPETAGMPVEPGETVVDRRVDLGLVHVMPGQYTLRVEVAFSSDEGTFSMAGSCHVLFALPSSQSISFVCPVADKVIRLTGSGAPEWPGTHGLPFGEQEEACAVNAVIRAMKGRYGLCFAPLPMRYDCASASEGHPADTHCNACGATLIEGGPHCHACGQPVPLPQLLEPPAFSLARGFCCYCREPKGRLRGAHRYCPECGELLFIHAEIKTASAYMEGVQAPAQIRLHTPATADLKIEAQQLQLGHSDNAVTCPIFDFHEGQQMEAGRDAIEFPVTIHSPAGSVSGQRYLFLTMTLEYGGARYTLEGRKEVRVIPAGEEKFVSYNFGAQSIEAAEAAVSAGTWSINVNGAPAESKRDAFITKLFEADWEQAEFTPVRLTVTSAEPALDAEPMPAPPSCEPMTRARLFFNSGGMPCNYVLLSKNDLILGRSAPKCDVRLLEVETCIPRMKAQVKRGEKTQSKSAVSGVQWQLQWKGNCLLLTQLSGSNITCLVPGGEQLSEGQTAPVARGDAWEIPGALGLEVAAAVNDFAERSALYERAGAILAQRADAGTPGNIAAGGTGGFTLQRLHSLHGQYADGMPEYAGFEAYVIMPGWASIGAAPEAAIRVEEAAVAPIHAWILHRGGFYFVAPAHGAAPVIVNDAPVNMHWPHPLQPGDTLWLGGCELRFDTYQALYLS